MMSWPVSPAATGLVVRADDGEVPAVEGQADADRWRPVEACPARDDRRLGRPVGVPHLALRGDQPLGELGRARLAAEDEQPHRLERLGRPQGGEGRDRRHDRDLLRDEPGAEVHAGAHEAAGRRHETGAVAPGEPHLLARGVERHREPASTRSPGPIGLSCKNIRASASTNAAADRCETATPLGTPVEPDVKMTHASSPTLTCGRARRGDREAARRDARTVAGTVTWRRGPTTAVTAASEKTRSARSWGSSTSTGT